MYTISFTNPICSCCPFSNTVDCYYRSFLKRAHKKCTCCMCKVMFYKKNFPCIFQFFPYDRRNFQFLCQPNRHCLKKGFQTSWKHFHVLGEKTFKFKNGLFIKTNRIYLFDSNVLTLKTMRYCSDRETRIMLFSG